MIVIDLTIRQRATIEVAVSEAQCLVEEVVIAKYAKCIEQLKETVRKKQIKIFRARNELQQWECRAFKTHKVIQGLKEKAKQNEDEIARLRKALHRAEDGTRESGTLDKAEKGRAAGSGRMNGLHTCETEVGCKRTTAVMGASEQGQ